MLSAAEERTSKAMFCIRRDLTLRIYLVTRSNIEEVPVTDVAYLDIVKIRMSNPTVTVAQGLDLHVSTTNTVQPCALGYPCSALNIAALHVPQSLIVSNTSPFGTPLLGQALQFLAQRSTRRGCTLAWHEGK